MIHGRLDISGPVDVAWRLHQEWPGSRLTIIEDEGHGGQKMVDAFVAAIASFVDVS
jgi:proline iminopeptidase